MAREAMLTPENVDRAALERWGGLCCNVEVNCGVQVCSAGGHLRHLPLLPPAPPHTVHTVERGRK